MRRAIDERRPDLLSIIGKGEMSIAIRWSEGGSPCVIKRVPPFPTRASADQYIDLVREHIVDLETNGVRCVSTEMYTLDRGDGSAVVYHCQPLLDADLLADHVLQRSEPAADHPLLVAVLDSIVGGVRAGVPIDAQFANWFWFENEAWQLDFSTPLMVDSKGDIRFDSTGFQREYPAALRRIVYKELMKIAPHYVEIEWVLTDVMTQLYREGLEAWCAPFTEAAKQRHQIELSTVLAKERFDSDSKFYPNLLRMKRLQRGWIQRTRRRYDGLLPETTSFGK